MFSLSLRGGGGIRLLASALIREDAPLSGQFKMSRTVVQVVSSETGDGAVGKPQVLLTRPDIAPKAIQLMAAKYDLTVWPDNSPASREFLLQNIAGKAGVCCFLNDKIDKELLDAAGPHLKVVSTFSVGYDHIDVQECKKRGIRIGYTPDVLTEATAELTMGLLLSASRRLIEARDEAANGGWTTWAPYWMTGPGLADSTVGIVGFGRIGRSVADKVKAFRAKTILYYNRSERAREAAETGARRVGLDELLARSDFVVCCVAFSPETRGLFDAAAFGKMKRTAVFVNTSRGGLVDQDALVSALVKGDIGAAGLDVTTPEPLPLDSALFKLKNCVVLPHIGSASVQARTAMSGLVAENLIGGVEATSMPAELKL